MSSPTIHEARIAYRQAMINANMAEDTIKQYCMVVRQMERAFPGRRVGGVTTDDLRDLLYNGVGERPGLLVGKATGTGTTYRSALGSFFRYARQRNWVKRIVEVPAPAFPHRGPRPQLPPTRLTEEELLMMLEHTDEPRIRCLMATAMSTALRIGDLRKIKLTEIDLRLGDLRVWVKKTRRFDIMPITMDLDEEIRRYMAWYTGQAGVTLQTEGAYLIPGHAPRNSPGTGWMYHCPDPYRQVSYDWAAVRLRDLFTDCGIAVEKREAWHTIRRSVARIYFDRLRGEISHDHALRQTMALLGHKNAETTERYLGMQAEVQARNASLRGRRFFQPAGNVTPISRAR